MSKAVNTYIDPIASLVLTRGYGGNTMEAKQFHRGTLHAATWNPSVTIRSRTDDQDDWVTSAISGEETNRLKWLRPFNAPYRDPANPLDDHHAPYREDYSLDWAVGIEMGTGLLPDQLAEFKRRFDVPRRGRWVQIEVGCSKGAMAVRGVAVEGQADFVPPYGAKD